MTEKRKAWWNNLPKREKLHRAVIMDAKLRIRAAKRLKRKGLISLSEMRELIQEHRNTIRLRHEIIGDWR